MKDDHDLATDLLNRSIAVHEQRLANAQASNNTRLVSRTQRDLERLLAQKQKMAEASVEKLEGRKVSKRRAKKNCNRS